MSQLQYFDRLRTYEEWANREVLSFFKRVENPSPRAVKFFAHILAAEHLWLSRINNEKQMLPVWPEFSLAECEAQLHELAAQWKIFMKDLTEARLRELIFYRNTKGEEWQNAVSDILTHVFTHSAYHRGRIATAMREAGFTPAYTDFIHAVRAEMVK